MTDAELMPILEPATERLAEAPEAGHEPERDAPRRERVSPEQRDPAPAPTGPLLAVCALCGGAGASTLAYLTARWARRDAGRPVLVADTGGPTGGLAAYARVSSPRSLARAANAIAARESFADGLFADGDWGLRVIAGLPHLDAEADEGGLARLLADARRAHELTVVDCGTLRGTADRQVASTASHVAWVLPATAGGVRRSERVLELFGRAPSRREVVVARHDASGRKPPLRDLAALAEARDAPLVLMPHVPDLAECEPEGALEAAELTLEAIATVLRR